MGRVKGSSVVGREKLKEKSAVEGKGNSNGVIYLIFNWSAILRFSIFIKEKKKNLKISLILQLLQCVTQL